MTEEDLAPGFEILPQPPKRRHGKLLTSIAAVVVLGAGGAISYVAFSASGGGASSPDKAVQNVIGDLQNADLIGVLDDLAPGERAALSGALNDDVASLKRLGVLADGADPTGVSGVHFAAHDLTYADKTITVNDHVQIVQITGGSVDLGGNVAQLPFTQRFLDLTHAPDKDQSQHVTIDHPVRIAAEKVDGGWYASLFYTAADAAAGHRIPAAGDSIPAVGADTPEDAVDKLIRSALSLDLRSVIGIVSPDELGALHDYGAMLAANLPTPHALPVTLKSIDFTSTPITDGMRVSIKDVSLTVQGQQINAAINGGCATVDAGPLHETVCPKDAPNLIGGLVGGLSCAGFSYGSSSGGSGGGMVGPHHVIKSRASSHASSPMPAPAPSILPSSGAGTFGCQSPKFTDAQKQAITDLLTGLISSGGVDTAQVGGQWFITPVRTLADLGANVLGALKGDDLYVLSSIGR
ncbi:MAG TPA: hypothetical protein VFE19_05690 [Jatrophihabitantaceae bacterium]|nr:hypothetical protein [Jatrophihabitantaceae bacterium]